MLLFTDGSQESALLSAAPNPERRANRHCRMYRKAEASVVNIPVSPDQFGIKIGLSRQNGHIAFKRRL